MDAHGVRASQTVLHRPRAEVQKRLRVDVVRGRPGLRRPLRAPIPVQPYRAALDRERMAGRQLAQCLEERAVRRMETDSGQVRRHRGFVQLAGDARRGEGGFHRTGEDEAVRRPGVVEGPDTDRVPGAEQQTVARVPHGKGVIAEQVVRAVPPPTGVGPEDQVTVRQAGAFRAGHAERGAERTLVVEPGVRGQDQARVTVEVQRRFGPVSPGDGSGKAPTPQADRPLRPPRAVLPGVAERRQHGVQPVRFTRFAQMEPADRVHEAAASTGRRRGVGAGFAARGKAGAPRGEDRTTAACGPPPSDTFRAPSIMILYVTSGNLLNSWKYVLRQVVVSTTGRRNVSSTTARGHGRRRGLYGFPVSSPRRASAVVPS